MSKEKTLIVEDTSGENSDTILKKIAECFDKANDKTFSIIEDFNLFAGSTKKVRFAKIAKRGSRKSFRPAGFLFPKEKLRRRCFKCGGICLKKIRLLWGKGSRGSFEWQRCSFYECDAGKI